MSTTQLMKLSITTESYSIEAVEPDIAAILVKDRNGEALTEIDLLSLRYAPAYILTVNECLRSARSRHSANSDFCLFMTFAAL